MDDFESIYLEHSEGIYRFLYKMSTDAALSEELTQECFFQAWRSFGRYNGRCELFTWLAAIAKNLYFSHLRKNKSLTFNPELLYEEEETSSPPEDSVLREERALAVRRAVNKLPKKYRDVVVLRIYAELTFSQIASVLSVSESSAKVLFYRAKSKLKEELSHACL